MSGRSKGPTPSSPSCSMVHGRWPTSATAFRPTRSGPRRRSRAWFNGPSDGATVDVQAPAGRLQLQLTDADLSGTLTLPDGRRATVSGRSVAADGDAGLYRAEASGAGGTAVGGWIIAPDGQQRGGVGTANGGTTKSSGARVLSLSQPTFSPQGLATARIAKVGITPIPIP